MLESTAFYGLEIAPSLPSMFVPLTNIYFKYDKKKEKFLPANHKFQDYILKNIEYEKTQVNRQESEEQFADVLSITLKYIYAGKEKEGWNFFDENYNFTDRKLRKDKIKKVLLEEPVYKFVKNELDAK